MAVENEKREFSVLDYLHAHSQLVILEENGETKRYWGFETVAYFEGPMMWIGSAGFQLESNHLCLQFLHQDRRFTGIPDDYLLQSGFKFFTAPISDADESRVKIVAENLGVFDHNPLDQLRARSARAAPAR